MPMATRITAATGVTNNPLLELRQIRGSIRARSIYSRAGDSVRVESKKEAICKGRFGYRDLCGMASVEGTAEHSAVPLLGSSPARGDGTNPSQLVSGN